MNDRITYLDTAKGLLMLLLIYGHLIINALAVARNGGGIPSLGGIAILVPYYRCFFMQTFFIITGYCSGFNYSTSDFLWRNFKTLILPGIFFIPISLSCKFLLNENTSTYIPEFVFNAFTSWFPWFLTALFFSKISLYVIIKYCRQTSLQVLIIASMYIAGCFFSRYSSKIDIWSWNHMLLMLPYLYLGVRIRKRRTALTNSFLICLSGVFVILLLIYNICRIKLPFVDYEIGVTFENTIPWSMLVIGGSSLILLLARKLSKVEWLQIFGKQSLFIYLFHRFALIVISKIVLFVHHPITRLGGVLFFVCVYGVTVLTLYFGCLLVEKRYLRWMLGKF